MLKMKKFFLEWRNILVISIDYKIIIVYMNA